MRNTIILAYNVINKKMLFTKSWSLHHLESLKYNVFEKYLAGYKSCFFKYWEKILEKLRSLALNMFNLRFWCLPWPEEGNSTSGRLRKSSQMPWLSDCRALSSYRRIHTPQVCYNSLRSQETPESCPGRRSSCRKSASANQSR